MVTAVMPGAFGFNPRLKPYPYDPRKAKELLAQAGFPKDWPQQRGYGYVNRVDLLQLAQ